jgi:hypothetical protein
MVSVFVGRRLTMTLLPPAVKKFYIYSDVPQTHTPSRRRVRKLRSGQMSHENEDEGNESEMRMKMR